MTGASRLLPWVVLCSAAAVAWCPARVGAIPVFARVYDKPCSTCHTVFPQLNPAGESFRAHGLHGVPAAIEPLPVGAGLTVPGTLPLALYLAGGGDVTSVDVPGERDSPGGHLNLNFLRVLAGGEIGRHLAFLADYELVEMEPDSGEVTINTLPYQAYMVAHAERWGWLANLKGGWYELPLGVSPQIHRLPTREYLTYGLLACALLDVEPPRGRCEDLPTPGETQIGGEVSAQRPASGLGWAVGLTNGSNMHVESAASADLYVRLSQALGPYRTGLFLSYSPDIVGHGVHDQSLRLGPDIDLYSRRFRLLGQFLAAYESNPTDHDRSLWYYGAFLEGQYRLTTALLSMLRIEYAWAERFDDIEQGGETRAQRRLWEVTAGSQWLLLENLKLIVELTYGEDHEAVDDRTTRTWAATVRLATAFWPFAPPGLHASVPRGDAP